MQPSNYFPQPEKDAVAEYLQSHAATDNILHYFKFAHLPPSLQDISYTFAKQAAFVVENVPRNAERTVALRKLLESKDAAVRAKAPV